MKQTTGTDRSITRHWRPATQAVRGGTWTRGAARLALRTGVPLVPVRIRRVRTSALAGPDRLPVELHLAAIARLG